ncbi:hypothetical protein C0991_001955 [Blastosporella zonata]|nr:hypothetical protein C0991_001955 [Blastosporella zonata]
MNEIEESKYNSSTQESMDDMAPSTHASRNPGKDVIPPRVHKKKAARTTSNKIQHAQKKERQAALKADIANFLDKKEILAKSLAEKHNTKIEKVRQMLSASLLIKPTRRASLWNALVSQQSKELNEEELDNGMHKDVDEDKLLNELDVVCKIKTQGAHSSNKAAALDYNAAMDKFGQDLENLHEHCGTMGFAFFTRGHINDTILPGWVESQQSLRFFNDVLDITPAEVLQKFEQWACTKDWSE